MIPGAPSTRLAVDIDNFDRVCEDGRGKYLDFDICYRCDNCLTVSNETHIKMFQLL